MILTFSLPEDTNITVPECAAAGSTQYYWYRVVLEATDGIHESGTDVVIIDDTS